MGKTGRRLLNRCTLATLGGLEGKLPGAVSNLIRPSQTFTLGGLVLTADGILPTRLINGRPGPPIASLESANSTTGHEFPDLYTPIYDCSFLTNHFKKN